MTNKEFNQDLRNLCRAFKIYQTGVMELSERSDLSQDEINNLVGELHEYVK